MFSARKTPKIKYLTKSMKRAFKRYLKDTMWLFSVTGRVKGARVTLFSENT
jgi:hypothetical protein